MPKKMAPIVAAGDSNSVNTKAKFGNAQYAASPIMNGASNSQLAASVLGQSANQTSLFNDSPDRNIVHVSPELNIDFDDVDIQGLEKQRPEIVSLINFVPAYLQTEGVAIATTAVNDLLTVQLNLRYLGEEIINDIIRKLYQDAGIKKEINDRRNNFIARIQSAGNLIQSLNGFFKRQDQFRDIINFKKYKSVASGQIPSVSVQDIFVNEFGFDSDNIKRFSNTKMINQFVEEYYNTAVFYSYNFLTTQKNDDRILDDSPFIINKSPRIDLEKALTKSFGPYSGLLGVLPDDTGDKIKLLSNFLGREFMVSYALGDSALLATLNNSGAGGGERSLGISSVGNPFIKVIGRPGNTILQPTTDAEGNTSSLLASTAFSVAGGAGAGLVLPYESKWIVTDSESEALFIPGDRYIFAPMIRGTTTTGGSAAIGQNTQKDLDRLIDVAYRANATRNIQALNRLLVDRGIDVQTEKAKGSVGEVKFSATTGAIDATVIFDAVLDVFKNMPAHITVAPPGGFAMPPSLITVGLINFSKTDNTMRKLLENFFRPDFNSEGELRTVAELLPTGHFNPANNELTKNMWDFTSSKKSLLNLILDRVYTKNAIYYNINKPGPSYTKYDRGAVHDLMSNNVGPNGIENSIIWTFLSTFQDLIQGLTDRNITGGSTRSVSNFQVNVGDSASINTTRFRTLSHREIWTLMFELFLNTVHTILPDLKITKRQATTFGVEGSILLGFLTKAIEAIKTPGTLNSRSLQNTIESADTTSLTKPTIPSGLVSGSLKLHNARLAIENETTILKRLQRVVYFFSNIVQFKSGFVSFFERTEDLNFLWEWKKRAYGHRGELAIYNKQQAMLSNRAWDEYRSIIEANKEPLPGDSEIGVEAWNFYLDDIRPGPYVEAFKAILQSKDFVLPSIDGNQIKILSVGVPPGLSSLLKEKVILSAGTSLDSEQKETDVIEIFVYKQDLEYENIQFVPQSYLFELSRFTSKDFNTATELEFGSGFGPPTTLSLDSIMKDIQTYDYSNGAKIIPPRGGSGSDAPPPDPTITEFPAEAYDNTLSKTQREKIRKNHIISHFMALYVRMLTGIDLRESNFLISGNRRAYRPSDPALDELFNLIGDSEEMQVWARLFGTKTLLTTGLDEARQMLTPKRFERIFNIPIRPDDFVIDVEATKATPGGEQQLSLLEEKGLLMGNDSTVPLTFPRVNKDMITLERFYTVISTLVPVATKEGENLV